MVLRAGPSGPTAIRAESFFFDWGTIPPGQSQSMAPFVPPPGYAVEVTTIGPFPADTFGLAVWTTSNAAFVQAFNNLGVPVFVGVMEYLAILTNVQVAR